MARPFDPAALAFTGDAFPVAEAVGNVANAGFGGFSVSDSGPPVAYGELWLDDEEGEVELARLLVAPEHRGQGLGRVLVRELVAHARTTHPELPDVILRVRPENAQAIRAYVAAGFVDVPAGEQATWNEGQRFAYHWMVMPA